VASNDHPTLTDDTVVGYENKSHITGISDKRSLVERYGLYTAVYCENAASYTVPFYCARDYEKIRSVYGAVLSKFTVKIRIAETIDLGYYGQEALEQKSEFIEEITHNFLFVLLRSDSIIISN
jgi:hypothetical protein